MVPIPAGPHGTAGEAPGASRDAIMHPVGSTIAPANDAPARRHRGRARVRTGISVVLVALATFAGGLLALWSYSTDARLTAGTVSLSVSPFHAGALDVYVPVLDWGVRFGGVKAPARLRVDVRAVDRSAVKQVATAGLPGTRVVRAEARDAIAAYLKRAALLAAVSALAAGLLVIAALRRRRAVSALLSGGALAGAIGWMAAVALFLAPHEPLSTPEYYAYGSDIPVALRTLEAASRSSGVLGEELDNQLLGLARLVTAPGNRVALAGLPRLTVASDLHNNVLAIASIRRAAAGGPVVLAGDLSDRGTPLEQNALSSVVRAGRPLVFVGGNHDSDTSTRALARAGAIVLTRREGVRKVAGLRFAGYESPNLRQASADYADRGAVITPEQQAAFTAWLLPLADRVDVVVVHEPALAAAAVAQLRQTPPAHPIVVVEGHTHRSAVDEAGNVTRVNGGTAGGGGTGNLTDRQPLGLAVLTFARKPFAPLAVDLVPVSYTHLTLPTNREV